MTEIIVDLFAGGGGASTGIELATGRAVKLAINHDRDAILMHRTNHPLTMHHQTDVWDVDPPSVCGGLPVGLLWASPDCKHFSKAKGGKPRDKTIRGLAWVVLRWAGTVRPRVIILENVEEFQTWGPVRKGKPVKKKAGETFLRFISQLRDLGYEVEWRELIAADYGAPTTRKRFFLIARCDGRPIVWPQATHYKDREPRWRSAAEIIDWSLPMFSIFDTREEIKAKYGATAVRPLADNTLRRIIRGVDKFTIKSGSPFLVFSNTGGSVGSPVSEPVGTVRTAGGQVLTSASLIQYHTEQTEHARVNGLRGPLPTVDAANRYGLTAAHLTEYYGNGNPLDPREPLHTITSRDREALTVAHVVEFKGKDTGQSCDAPLRTITAGGGEFAAAGTEVRQYRPGTELGRWPQVRELLNKYCGYHLAGDEVLLLRLGGKLWYISDITLRMLTPRELYRAMGFPEDYIIDHDYRGNEYKKAAQVARCGNAVPPAFAEALVRANLPEWCGKRYTTMKDLRTAQAG